GVAGVGLIAEVGVPAIQAHVRGLVERLVTGLEELGAKVAAPPGGPLVCIRSTDAPALVTALAAEEIIASERDSSLRISLHLYNTVDDVDAVLAALAKNPSLVA
ncbi:MAG: aminotransferase class V-fold PLP-dependent enzyme, partial [Gaiellaceae bacterium]